MTTKADVSSNFLPRLLVTDHSSVEHGHRNSYAFHLQSLLVVPFFFFSNFSLHRRLRTCPVDWNISAQKLSSFQCNAHLLNIANLEAGRSLFTFLLVIRKLVLYLGKCLYKARLIQKIPYNSFVTPCLSFKIISLLAEDQSKEPSNTWKTLKT